MRVAGIIVAVVFSVAVSVMAVRAVTAGKSDPMASAYFEKLAGKVEEMDAKINDLVACQIKGSESNRQVYSAVARLCTIFEGILQINQEKAGTAKTGSGVEVAP